MEKENDKIESNTNENFSLFNNFSVSPVLCILSAFQDLPKKDFFNWLDKQQEFLLTYEKSYTKNEILKFIEQNKK